MKTLKDIERCWRALKSTCEEAGSSSVRLVDVMVKLKPILTSTFGDQLHDPDSEAFVASFIAGLFLTHRRMASISQDGEALEAIMIEDLWPNLDNFQEVLDEIESLMAEDSDGIEGDATGSVHRMEAIAERARVAEEKATRRQARLDAIAEKERLEEAPSESDFSDHEWLVE